MVPRADVLRLFFALWPSDELRDKMERTLADICVRAGGRRVATRNLHVTLAFIGATRAEAVASVLQAGAQTHGEPFELTLDRVESWRGSRLLTLTSESAPAPLAALVDDLRAKVLQAGFKLKHEEFRPHVTLVRDMPRAFPTTAVEPIVWRVRDFVLVQSRPGPGGSEYAVMERWPLVG